MLKNAVIENYPDKIRSLIRQILEIALNSNDLKNFLDEIVEIGAETTEAKSCSIFLLEESENRNGKILRLYSTSGDMDKILKDEKAKYYIPKRSPFTKKGEGKDKIIAYLRRYFLERCNYTEEKLEIYEKELLKEGKTLINVLWENEKSLINIVKKMGDDLIDLIEKGELPMGITAVNVKTKEFLPLLHGAELYEHPEWIGTHRGIHEICTSLVQVPLLKSHDGEIVGIIKIENHKLGDSHCFTGKHKEILSILADSIVIAIQQIIYKSDTYKKLYGTEILKKINELKIESPPLNKEIQKPLKEFYSKLEIEIEDVGGIDRIYTKVTKLVSDIAQTLNLYAVLDIIDSIGPAFETLLGTDVQYREHFIHQFNVFLLGYYLINKKSPLRKKLINHLQKINPDYTLEDVLKVWFITAMFHDFNYSVEKMESWLKNYFLRVALPSRFYINWADIFTSYEIEKMNLIELIYSNSDKSKDEIANIIKDAFIGKHDHGIICGLMLMDILDVEEGLLKEACCAIALHTKTVYSKLEKLKIDNFPFAFLLVFCDNAQEWGRPVMMNLIPHLDVKLEDIITDEDKVDIKLRYQKLTSGQKRIIETNTAPLTKYWYSKPSLKFGIKFYESTDKEPFRHYIFPFE
ncbi:MAG: GAF domain-containing protein [Methanobacteriaceae archaeon]|jgi:hypothetical protein